MSTPTQGTSDMNLFFLYAYTHTVTHTLAFSQLHVVMSCMYVIMLTCIERQFLSLSQFHVCEAQ